MTSITTDKAQLIEKISKFINETGIECIEGRIPDQTFLPGMEIQYGRIVYDPGLLAYPGDLLHEAGHLAVLLPEKRMLANGSDNLSGEMQEGASEMCAIAWSWAAKEQLGLAAEDIFHDAGYQGGSENIINAFSDGHYFGTPMLQLFGMTKEPKPGIDADEFTYPKMKFWLRQ